MAAMLLTVSRCARDDDDRGQQQTKDDSQALHPRNQGSRSVTVKRFGENMRSSKVSDFSAAESEALRIDSNRIDVLRIMVAWKKYVCMVQG